MIRSFSGDVSPAGERAVPPVVAALWFAVVFGLSTLMLPAATPPLDIAARALIALAAAGIGAMAGLALAHVLAAGRGETSRASCLGMPVPRPLNAREELAGVLDSTERELSQVRPEPVNASLRHAGLVELTERLRIVVEHRRAAPGAPNHAANAGAVIEDIDSALRASLARLRQLRGAV